LCESITVPSTAASRYFAVDDRQFLVYVRVRSPSKKQLQEKIHSGGRVLFLASGVRSLAV
jgi:hypothetical protein